MGWRCGPHRPWRPIHGRNSEPGRCGCSQREHEALDRKSSSKRRWVLCKRGPCFTSVHFRRFPQKPFWKIRGWWLANFGIFSQAHVTYLSSRRNTRRSKLHSPFRANSKCKESRTDYPLLRWVYFKIRLNWATYSVRKSLVRVWEARILSSTIFCRAYYWKARHK